MQYKRAINYLFKLELFGTKLGLSRIQELLKNLNNPEKSLKIIHIAGTNGKGSTAAMTSTILQEAGYKVGLYTSPHLKDIRERFLINNKKISKDDFVKYFLKTKKFDKKQTFFEFTTAMALLYFKERKVDFLILETGLGGRLDATNVVNPIISIITNIDLEHTQYLGNKIEKIAYEKAGIIKNKTPVITLAKGSALKVIKKIAKFRNSKVIIPKKHNFKTNLKGDFQISNSNIAVETISLLNRLKLTNINKITIKNSLKKVNWPGRLEFKNNILFDCAHNAAAVKELTKYLKKNKLKDLILVFGVLSDKNYKLMLKLLLPFTKKIILTKPSIKRALNPIILAEEIKKSKKYFLVIEDVKNALKYAKAISSKKDLILVTGSIYVVGEVI